VALFYLTRFGATRPLQDAVTSPIQDRIDEPVCLLEDLVVLAVACCNNLFTVVRLAQHMAQNHFAELICMPPSGGRMLSHLSHILC
jgi:hypothetical protein